jgi:hypothetical protein
MPEFSEFGGAGLSSWVPALFRHHMILLEMNELESLQEAVDLTQVSKVEASILVKISSCSYLEIRFPLTKNI